MQKAERHFFIKQTIEKFPIHSQIELLYKLQQQKVYTTQSTVSRDIHELTIIKAPDENGIFRFVILHTDDKNYIKISKENGYRLSQLLKDIVVKIERIHFLTIVHTLPANASLFAATLDKIKHPQIVNTIAGFDTIIIISENEYKSKIVKNFLINNQKFSEKH